jgi:hypothetical protein
MRIPNKKLAYWIGGTGVVALLGSVFSYWFLIDGEISNRSGDWGTFGDFVGGMAGTVIALATLIALVVTLQLQATELDKTSKALTNQVNSSNKQLALIEKNERIRIQPVLKVEWFPYKEDKNIAILRFANIGFGPCLMERVHVFVQGAHVGSHDLKDWEIARTVWGDALSRALGTDYPGPTNIRVEPTNKYRKLLAAGEFQQMLAATFPDHKKAQNAIFRLQTLAEVDIEFKSLGKVTVHTSVQEMLF